MIISFYRVRLMSSFVGPKLIFFPAPMLFSEIKTEYPSGEGELPTFKDPHPVWRPHLLQGWAPDWIPSLVDKATSRIDNVVHIGGDAAMATSKALAQQEGIFTGTSGGGIMAAALNFAATAEKGSSIVAVLPDTGERYLSTPLFDGIGAGACLQTAKQKNYYIL